MSWRVGWNVRRANGWVSAHVDDASHHADEAICRQLVLARRAAAERLVGAAKTWAECHRWPEASHGGVSR
jgi:hypothetical protein